MKLAFPRTKIQKCGTVAFFNFDHQKTIVILSLWFQFFKNPCFLLVKIEKMRQFYTFEFPFREMLASFYPILGHSSANSFIFEKIKVSKTKKTNRTGIGGGGGWSRFALLCTGAAKPRFRGPPSPLPFGFCFRDCFFVFFDFLCFSPNQCSSRLLDWFLVFDTFIFSKMNALVEEWPKNG